MFTKLAGFPLLRAVGQGKRASRGFTLVEAAIVLGVIGAILGAVWGMASSAQRNVRQEKFSEMLLLTVEKARGYYAGMSGVESTLVTTVMPNLISRQVFPSEAVQQVGANYKVLSPFGSFSPNPNGGSTLHTSFYVCGWKASGSVRCEFSGAGTANVPFFAVEVLAKKTDCIGAVMMNSTASSRPGLVAVYTNGVQRALPLSLTTASTACAAATNYIDFVFRLTPS